MRSTTENKFPCYEDGDVIISLSARPEDMLVLHSAILKLSSEFFRASLSEPWIQNKIVGTKTCGNVQIPLVRYEWEFSDKTFDKGIGGDCGMLIGKTLETDPAHRCRPPHDSPVDLDFAKENYREVLLGYKLAFALLYQQDCCSVLSPLINSAHPALIIAELVRCASVLGFLHSISGPLTVLILEPSNGIWKYICSYGEVFLSIACLLRSRAIFEEALRHAANYGLARNVPLRYCQSPEYSLELLRTIRNKARNEIGMKVTEAHNNLFNIETESWIVRNNRLAHWRVDSVWHNWLQDRIINRQNMDYLDPNTRISMPFSHDLARGVYDENHVRGIFQSDPGQVGMFTRDRLQEDTICHGLVHVFSKARETLSLLWDPEFNAKTRIRDDEYPTYLDFYKYCYPWEKK
ncbi:hypothetical protein NA57DRAFT_55795 [Rhizodiscina lignyota]|uniref:BTB domain-containing protein n=1 Tax=Rhizodiscina lignyota TaxID=1504668 RepID=A0A9P4IJW9_9PEZI|nr:hypothetical protein NA57DRAFT_55795 [Rhizodiscina lignyota]